MIVHTQLLQCVNNIKTPLCTPLQRVAEADAEASRLRHERMVLDDEREVLDAERREADVAMQARSTGLPLSVMGCTQC